MNSLNIQARLAFMSFLEFAVWGAYQTCMGNYLGRAGLGEFIAWFYAIQGIAAILMPMLLGIVADKWVEPQRLWGFCHLLAGLGMVGLFAIGEQSSLPNAPIFIAVYSFSVGFYIPTISLANTTAFSILRNHDMDTVKNFPPIRVFGTVGFVFTMWIVNCATWENGSFLFLLGENAHKFQYTHHQFLVSGILCLAIFLYSFTLPACPLSTGNKKRSFAQMLGLNAFKIFKSREMVCFFIFSGLLGMCLQVTNAFATPFITSFKGDPAQANTFAANNATLLISISQIAEAFCILLIPFFLKRFGIKAIMLIAMIAWALRFGFFGLGSPAFPGVILFVLSCLTYGIAFDFFNVSGGLFVDQKCSPQMRASAQGLFMFTVNGLGGIVGTLAAGKVVNHFCAWKDGFLLGNWTASWLIFAGFSLAVAMSFAILFKPKPLE